MEADTRKWHISKAPECISVMTYLDIKGFGRPSSCTATLMGDYWYLNRVIVAEEDRGKGLGSRLLERLKAALNELWSDGVAPEHQRLVVTPGGYSSTPEDLELFYKACGFVTKTPIPELLMEWQPKEQVK